MNAVMNFRVPQIAGISLRKGSAPWSKYRGANKSLARPNSLCILFDGENISFDVSLVICIYK